MFELIRHFMHVQFICKFQLKLSRLCSGQCRTLCFGIKGRATPKSVVRSGRNSKILCLSRVSASLIAIPLKLKWLCSGQKVKYCVFRHSRASNTRVNSPIWPEFEFIRDFMAILVTCKFEDDSIKGQGTFLRTTFSA